MIPNWSDRVKYLFYKPGWLPDNLGGYRTPKEIEANFQKFDTIVPSSMNWYVFTQYVFVLVLTGFFLFKVDSFTWLPKVLVSTIIIWTTVSFSGVFEKRNWYFPQELLRILAFSGVVFFLIQSILPLPFLVGIIGVFCLCSFVWLWKNQQLKSQIPSISL